MIPYRSFILLVALLLPCKIFSNARSQQACSEIVNMLEEKQPLSIKRAVYIAEWAYLHGELDIREG